MLLTLKFLKSCIFLKKFKNLYYFYIKFLAKLINLANYF
jgi:hypothetical protein